MLWSRTSSVQEPPRMGGDPSADHLALHRYLGERLPSEDDVSYCERRIREEDALANAAGSWEAGLIHEQTAMLYRSQLASLHRRDVATLQSAPRGLRGSPSRS